MALKSMNDSKFESMNEGSPEKPLTTIGISTQLNTNKILDLLTHFKLILKSEVPNKLFSDFV